MRSVYKHRVVDVMEAIRNAPPPQYCGQVIKLPIRRSFDYYYDKVIDGNSVEQLLVLEAEQFADANGKRLEWTMSFVQ